MKRLYFFIVLACFGATARAASPVPGDFAFGLVMETPGAEAMYKITVPEGVYRSIYRADLGDIRIFNARGEAVPHMLRLPAQSVATKKESAQPAALPFFPVYEADKTLNGTSAIHFATNENGVVVDVTRAAGTSAAGSRIFAYLIDASAIKQKFSGLHIGWSDNNTGFTASVTVEASADLNQWQTIARSVTLAELDYGGYRLSRHTIDLPASTARYLRMSWPAERDGVRVVSVKALFPDMPTINRLARKWTDVTGRAVREKNTAYEYDSESKFLVDMINLKFPERNSLLQTMLTTRSDVQSAWRLHGQGLFYNLIIDGSLLQNSTLQVRTTTDRYWRLETKSESGIGSGIPVIQLGWIPHEVLFVARGGGPFTLAYGSAVVQPSAQPLDALLAALAKNQANGLVKEARITRNVTLGGGGMLSPPAAALPWGKWILWAVLAVGVSLLSAMAWKLFRQMNASSGEHEK